MPRANGYTRHQILTAVKVRGSMTADEIGRELGISPVAARQHLSALEAEGLIATSVERRGLGRPVHRYALTPAGDEGFPRAYDSLANTLLDEIRTQHGEDAVAALFRARLDRTRTIHAHRLSGKALDARLHELARICTEEGYMASAEANGHGLRFVQRNCAICRVARNHPAACASELEMIQGLVADQATAERTEHILSGGTACVYDIRPHG